MFSLVSRGIRLATRLERFKGNERFKDTSQRVVGEPVAAELYDSSDASTWCAERSFVDFILDETRPSALRQ